MPRKPNKPKVCSHCGTALGESRLVVHIAQEFREEYGPQGEFHVWEKCWSAAKAAKGVVKTDLRACEPRGEKTNAKLDNP